MDVIEPGKGRAIIENHSDGLRITIPARTYLFTTVITVIWFPFWIFGAMVVPYKLVTEPLSFGTTYLAFWLTLWMLGGAWALNVLLWNLAGREIIDLGATTLRRRKQIPLFSRSREYAVASIAGLRLAPPRTYRYYYQQDMSFLNFDDAGAIAFDYGRDTHRLGSGLEQADAHYVIQEMRKRVKSLAG